MMQLIQAQQQMAANQQAKKWMMMIHCIYQFAFYAVNLSKSQNPKTTHKWAIDWFINKNNKSVNTYLLYTIKVC